ncbi:hypothetical protein ACTFIT_005029, partial [Dictyostelium discoideum]
MKSVGAFTNSRSIILQFALNELTLPVAEFGGQFGPASNSNITSIAIDLVGTDTHKVMPMSDGINAIFSDSVPNQCIDNERKPPVENEDQQPSKSRRINNEEAEESKPQDTFISMAPSAAAINPTSVRILGDSGADINIIPKAALTMEQLKSREESNLVPTVANKTAAMAAKFEISSDVVEIILGSMGSTYNCKDDIWSIQVSKKQHQVNQYVRPISICLISELDEKFTKKGIKKEIRNWINNLKTMYNIQINDQEVFNHQPTYQVHKVNHQSNQEKYKVVEVKHQEWKEVQDQFIINHLKQNYKEVFDSLNQVPPSRKDQLIERLKKLWIERTKSEFGAPVIFAKKKNGKWRMFIDYRSLNEITIDDSTGSKKNLKSIFKVG